MGVILLFFILSLCKGSDLLGKLKTNDFVDRVSREGFKAEEHRVVTSDGYILRVFRVQSAGAAGAAGAAPVVLMHGLLQSADAWIDAGRDAGLAYLLADAGHDVWLPNARGTFYSRQHLNYNPDLHHHYWHFCRDQIATYDLPAIIDTVINRTHSAKISYIGFSQGAGTFFMLCSEMPEFCKKVKIMIALGPSTRHTNTKSLLFRSLTTFMEKAEPALTKRGVFEIFPIGSRVQRGLQYFCSISSLTTDICDLITDLADAANPGSISEGTLRRIAYNFPAGTSVHNMASYGQAVRSKEFHKFDYGSLNMRVYGSADAPRYNLSRVAVPVCVLCGANDGVVDVRDVRWTVRRLTNVKHFTLIDDPNWTHLDMTYSRKIPELLLPKIMECLSLT